MSRTQPALQTGTSTRLSKKFLYLVQSSGPLQGSYLGIPANDADLLLLTWKEPVDGAIYAPKSTWTEGRNRLVQEALNRPGNYKYFIFLDDDVTFIKGDWRRFEAMLLNYEPAIATPYWPRYEPAKDTRKDLEAQRVLYFDAMFNAFHYEVATDGILLPYYAGWDHESWWYSQWFVIQLAQLFYSGHVLQFNTIEIDNTKHSLYPKAGNFAKIQRWFEREVLAPPAIPFLPHDFAFRAYRKARRMIRWPIEPKLHPLTKTASYRVTHAQRKSKLNLLSVYNGTWLK